MLRLRTRTMASVAGLCLLWPAALAIGAPATPAAPAAPGTKTITFQDLMKFRAIGAPVISEDGTVVAYGLQPDRGDGEGVVHALATNRTIRGPARRIARHLEERPLRGDGREGGVCRQREDRQGQAEARHGDRERRDRRASPRSRTSIGSRSRTTRGGSPTSCPRPSRRSPPRGAEKAGAASPAAGATPAARPGAPLKLRDLSSGAEQEIPFVASFAFAPSSAYLAFVVSGAEGKGNGVFLKPLADAASAPVAAAAADKGRYESLTWTRDGAALAFLSGVEKPAAAAALWTWDAATRQSKQAASSEQAPKGWSLPLKNDVAWSRDGKHLYFGFKPPDRCPPAAHRRAGTAPAAAAAKDAPPDPYDSTRSSRRSKATCGTGTTRASSRSRRSSGSAKRTAPIAR